jgi:hypothetical protein
LTPEKISIGSSRTVNRKLVSLENRNREFRNIPQITAIPVTIRNTATQGITLINTVSDFITSIERVNTSMTKTLSNSEDTAFPSNTAARLPGERKISSRVPLIRSKENLQADWTKERKKLMHI